MQIYSPPEANYVEFIVAKHIQKGDEFHLSHKQSLANPLQNILNEVLILVVIHCFLIVESSRVRRVSILNKALVYILAIIIGSLAILASLK